MTTTTVTTLNRRQRRALEHMQRVREATLYELDKAGIRERTMEALARHGLVERFETTRTTLDGLHWPSTRYLLTEVGR